MKKISTLENQNKQSDFYHHVLNNIFLIDLTPFHIYQDYMYVLKKKTRICLGKIFLQDFCYLQDMFVNHKQIVGNIPIVYYFGSTFYYS